MLKTHDLSHVSQRWVQIPASPKKLDGPLDGRKTNQNNKDSQMGKVTPKIYLKIPVFP
jgi:hypothetical protein